MTVVGPDGTHWLADSLRGIEHASIRAFVQQAADDGYLSGRVLDYGCGKQPYRDIVETAGGEYVPFDRAEFPANVSGEDVGEEDVDWDDYDAVLCTQVVQYVPPTPWDMLAWFHHILGAEDRRNRAGHLVLTYPTNWPEVELEDLHRFTKSGMERLLTEAGFEIVRHEQRASVYCVVGTQSFHNEPFALGYGVIARA